MNSAEHPYAYARGNPLKFVDLLGTTATTPGNPDPEKWKETCSNAKGLSKNDPNSCRYGGLSAQPPFGLKYLTGNWIASASVCRMIPARCASADAFNVRKITESMSRR
jgi:hypothetical protein